MDRNIIEALLTRYLKGEASQEENVLIEKWLEENNNPHSEWQHFNKTRKDQWLAETFDRLQDSIRAANPKVVVMPQRKHLWRRIATVAAVLAICFTVYREWPVLHSHLYPVQLITLNTSSNQKKQITLADGSTVWVNAGSQLKFPEQFNGKTREIYLSGEAYFDIKHDITKPFIIHTGKLVTTVLGTAFNIKEDAGKRMIVVTVTRGKVSVANGAQQLGIITPNEQISFNLLNNKAVKKAIDASHAIAWQETDLHFDDIAFAEAAALLQQRFNVRISFANNKIKNCRFTGTALTGEKLDKILKVMCALNHATYKTKTDGSIVIEGPGCD